MSSNPHGLSPHGPTLQGIDVAYPQGKAFDWSLVAADGIRYAWIKATQGRTGVDPTWARNWTQARQHGVLRGAYCFLSPDSDPIVQADHYLRTVGELASDDLHPMLDVEVDRGQPAALVLDHAVRWCEHVEVRTGRPVVVYTYPSFMIGAMRIAAGHPLGSRPLWIAHYVVDPATGRVYSLRSPTVPAAWDGWAIWQTSGNRGPRIPGIEVDVDRDVFWGDEATFRERFSLVGHHDTLPAPAPSSAPVTAPHTPTSRSSQRLSAVREPIADGRTQPLWETVEGEHTVAPEEPEL